MPRPLTTAALATAALVGFAGNSLLCRAALGARTIDAPSFTAIRLGAGAVTLALLVQLRRRPAAGRGSWPSAIALFAYAIGFSLAYLRMSAATGALILFATVQVAMIGWSIIRGIRPRPLEWLGLAAAAAGLVVLVLPGLAAPDPLGATMMAIAGLSWGAYSLRGRGAADPLAVTADNFLRTLPFAAVALGIGAVTTHLAVSPRGALLATASGALASGIGYSLWYAALPALAATRAAIIQLGVPVLTAAAAVSLLGEPLTTRFVVAAAAIVGGIAIAIVARSR